jgi:hypothetical protein
MKIPMYKPFELFPFSFIQEFVLEKQSSALNMRNVRQAKRRASIANLEDGESTTINSGSIGFLKPPSNLGQTTASGRSSSSLTNSPNRPKKLIGHQLSAQTPAEEDDNFSDLENMLIQDLTS